MPAQGRVVTQLAVVESVQCRLVAVEHNLYFLVRASGRSARGQWPVGTVAAADRTCDPGQLHTRNSVAAITAEITAVVRKVDAAAGPWRRGRDHHALGPTCSFRTGIIHARIQTELRRRSYLRPAGEAVLEREYALGFDLFAGIRLICNLWRVSRDRQRFVRQLLDELGLRLRNFLVRDLQLLHRWRRWRQRSLLPHQPRNTLRQLQFHLLLTIRDRNRADHQGDGDGRSQ